MLGRERQDLLQSFLTALGRLIRNTRHNVHADVIKSCRARIRETSGKGIEIMQASERFEFF